MHIHTLINTYMLFTLRNLAYSKLSEKGHTCDDDDVDGRFSATHPSCLHTQMDGLLHRVSCLIYLIPLFVPFVWSDTSVFRHHCRFEIL